jgi:hypothetical protein
LAHVAGGGQLEETPFVLPPEELPAEPEELPPEEHVGADAAKQTGDPGAKQHEAVAPVLSLEQSGVEPGYASQRLIASSQLGAEQVPPFPPVPAVPLGAELALGPLLPPAGVELAPAEPLLELPPLELQNGWSENVAQTEPFSTEINV